ncbi:C40 family peptidase [Actinoplanes xinjiangensis]|uniref:C40 family peptidase n=1 Tax=Actinoplanes xinjiangensis TaxID=512350 RepID=UPI003440A768
MGWDSRECPGPISEATLHGSSTRRVLTAGALALAVIAPAPDQVEHGTEAVSTPLQALPVTPDLADHPLGAEIQKRQLGESVPVTAQAPWNRLRELRFDAGFEASPVRDGLEARAAAAERVSRVAPRRAVTARPVARVRPSPVSRRPVALARQAARPVVEARQSVTRPVEVRQGAARPLEARRDAVRSVEARRAAARPVGAREAAERPVTREIRAVRTTRARVERPAGRRVAVQQRRVTTSDRGTVRRSSRTTTVRSLRSSGGSRDMRAVIAFARSQVGKRYVRGGEGPGGFDCSGFTKRAYARAGLSLPHSSGGQARRARSVSRSQARPGDLVVGRGHVGIYMGRGMMIDAGNSRTGVVYRKVYRGLSVSRLK